MVKMHLHSSMHIDTTAQSPTRASNSYFFATLFWGIPFLLTIYPSSRPAGFRHAPVGDCTILTTSEARADTLSIHTTIHYGLRWNGSLTDRQADKGTKTPKSS